MNSHSRTRWPWWRIVSLFALFLIALATAYAQTFFGSIVGTATDESGAVIPGAQVTLINKGTAEVKTTETDASGNYSFLNLIPGVYKVEVKITGFNQFTQDGIQVQTQASVRIDVSLKVGDVSESVEVSAQALALQTETATLSQAVGGRNVQEMPLNGRNVYSLVALVPGVVMESGSAPQIGGGMANQNATYVDGVPMNTAYFNQTAAAPSQDSVEEFRVQTNTVSAEYGRFAGGIISLTSKSGTNEFHGSAYEFLRNRVLNANSFFSNRSGLERSPFTQNQFGGTLGGPVEKNKIFFFGSYEGFAQRSGSTTIVNTPTDAMRTGDFSGLLPNGITIADPLTSSTGANRTPFPNNQIPSSRLDKTATALTKLYYGEPNQSGYTNNYIANVGSGSNNNTISARGDADISSRQRIFTRFGYAEPKPYLVSLWNNDIYYLATGATRKNPQITAVFGDTYTLSPTVVADLRVAFLRNHNNRYPDQLGVDLSTVGWPSSYNAQISNRTLPQLCITNYDPGSTMCAGNVQAVIGVHNNVYDIAPSLSKVWGRHTIKVGVELRRAQLNYLQSNNNSGNFTFTSAMTATNALSTAGMGYSFASFMLGYGASGSLSQNAATTGEELYQAYYFNDSFVVNRKLTLNYGLRWEGLGSFTETWDRMTVLQPKAQNPLVSNLGALALVNSSDHPDRGPSSHPWHLFSPRLGVAYRLSEKTVIRTGAGINFLPTDGNIFSTPYLSPVNSINTTWVPSLDGGLTPYNTLSNPFPNGILSPPQRSSTYQQMLLGGSVTSPISSNPYAYTVQYNFSVQRELPGGAVLEAAYAGLRGVHLYRYPGMPLDQLPDQYLSMGSQLLTLVSNPYYGKVSTGTLAASTVTQGQLLRSYPQYTGFTVANAANGNSTYNALQVKLQRRFKTGGTLLASYTKSKLIGDVEQQASWSSAGAYTMQDYNNLRAERSLAGYDTPENLVISYVYDLPIGKGYSALGHLTPALEKLISGWGINGITTFQSGQPLGFLTAVNNTNSYGGNSRPNVAAGCTKTASGSAQARINNWFNTGCFSSPAAFTFGSESRTDPDLRTHGTNNFDFALFKDTHFTERMNLQFRAEIFNLFNRVQFAAPGSTYGSTTFGVVTSQANNPRLVQFGMRFSF